MPPASIRLRAHRAGWLWEAVRADEDVVAASAGRRLEEQVRDLERKLGPSKFSRRPLILRK
jgi:IS1 family transposase